MAKGEHILSDQAEGLHRLTERERECLRLVDRHMSSKEIARELGLSKHTVDWHLDKARRRLGASDRYDAARRMSDRAHQGPSPPPIASGSDPARLGEATSARSARGVEEGDPRERVDPAFGTDPLSEGRHWQGGPFATGSGELPPGLATAELGGPVAPHHLERAGAAAFQPVGDGGWRGDGSRPGVGHPQAGHVQAQRVGDAGDFVHRQRGDGRDLSAGLVLLGLGSGRPNHLSLPLRLAFIATVMIVTALAFGSILAGLHALEGLFP
ncbi:MAG: helix-turn-helix transcriptional regulator [Caulobacter vibrioides]|uniref:Helix-turn-helix transcriptional regulator n=1 Tax=Caulobacter vibrioides TaxID=155892 RepID=A0A258DCB8_CAUVI|nr:MAG: helix-turn-helix transcriptional regulator [Caulobacter vibrioides]